jgi:16S rRNA (uracil1498-N3)-methyltransferase
MSAVRRFKAPAPLAAGCVELAGEEARHLRVVLRGRAGDKVVLFDGAGREAEAEIVGVGRDSVECRVAGPVRLVDPPACRVELVCALPRAGAADDVVRVAVEAGASAIRPLIAERGVWRADDAGDAQRSERFTRAAVAALKQAGLAWMPELLPASAPADLAFAPGDLAIVGSVRPGAVPIREALEPLRPIRRAAVVVGPEGGLTEDEERVLVERGAVPVRAGPGTLRVETAAIVLVSHVLSFGPESS